MIKTLVSLMVMMSLNAQAQALDVVETAVYDAMYDGKSLLWVLSVNQGNNNAHGFYSSEHNQQVNFPKGSLEDGELYLEQAAADDYAEKTIAEKTRAEKTTAEKTSTDKNITEKEQPSYIKAHFSPAEQAFYGQYKDGIHSHELIMKRRHPSYQQVIKSVTVAAGLCSLEQHYECAVTIQLVYQNGRRQDLSYNTTSEHYRLVFEDLNFDGYPDLRVLTLGENEVNQSDDVFIYSAETQDFSAAPFDLTNLVVNYKNNTLTGFRRLNAYSYALTVMDYPHHAITTASFDYSQNEGRLKIESLTGALKEEAVIDKAFYENFIALHSDDHQ